MPPGGASNLNDAGNASNNNGGGSSRVLNDADTPDPNHNPITCSICKRIVSPEQDGTCGICYEPFISCSLLHPCHHVFDYECISTWLETLFDSDEWTPAKTTCPFCRRIIDTIERSNPAQSQGILELFRGSREREGAQLTGPIAIDLRGRERYLQLLYHRRQAGLGPYAGDSEGRRSRSLGERRRRVRIRDSQNFLFNFEEDEFNYGDAGPSNNDGPDWVSGAVEELPEDEIDSDMQDADYDFEDVLEDVGNMELLRVLEREVWENDDESGQSNEASSTENGASTTDLRPGLQALTQAFIAFPPYVPRYVAPVQAAPSAASPETESSNTTQQPEPRTPDLPMTAAEGGAQVHVMTDDFHRGTSSIDPTFERLRAESQAIRRQIDQMGSSLPTASSSQVHASNAHQISRRPVPTTPAPNIVTRATAERRHDLLQTLLDTYDPTASMPHSTRSTYPRLIPTLPVPTGARVISERRINGELIFANASASVSSDPVYPSTGMIIPLAHRISIRPVASVSLPVLIPVRATAGPSSVREQTPAVDTVMSEDEADGAAAANGTSRAGNEQRRAPGTDRGEWMRRYGDLA